MIDVKQGDLLVVDGVEYPVRDVCPWKTDMTLPTFLRLATVTCSTKRNPPVVDGKRELPITNLEFVRILPLDRVSVDQVHYREDLKSPFRVYETFTADNDSFLQILVEDVR